MTVKHLVCSNTGRHLYFGRKQSVAPIPHLILANYLDKSRLPDAPDSCSYNRNASSVYGQMYGNDRLGNCVPAGIGHLIGTFTSIFSRPTIFSVKQIIAMYSRIGGYIPGRPDTDRGCDVLTALNYWRHYGFVLRRHNIVGFARVNPTDPQEYKTALWMFCHLMKGINLPDGWVNPFPKSGDIWDVEGPPNPEQGHFIVTCEYDQQGTIDDTWGMQVRMTDAAIETYCSDESGGELWIALSPEIINHATGKSPSGFNANQLMRDLGMFGGIPVSLAATQGV